MHKIGLRIISVVGLSGLLLLTTALSATAQPQWQGLANAPGVFLDTCLLLTDGTVMCHQYNSNAWRRLTPDNFGSYLNGTWSAMPNMPNGTDNTAACSVAGGCPYRPLYFASAVLPSGNVVVIGGEYNNLVATWTNIGFMFNPVTNAWSTQIIEAFGRGRIGDAQTVVLQNGTMLLADIATGNIEAFNPNTLAFTALNPTGKLDRNNEENWNILPSGRVLTVDARLPSSFEIYNPVTNTWGNSGATAVNLADCCGAANGVGNSAEVGPGVLRPDGTLVYFSGNSLGQNAVYDTLTGTWTHTAAMDFPLVPGQTYHYSVADGPASLLPNGNVLVMASPVTNTDPFNTPSRFFEFDGANNLTQVVSPPNAASFIAYQGRMLLLASGEVLLTAYNQAVVQDVQLYSNGGAPQNAWRPVITVAPNTVVPSGTYPISGRLFNGLSEGATYGDDAAMSTNYPLVRITNAATGHVVYARTHDHSRMGVEEVNSLEIITTQFDAPAGLEPGPSYLVVVANGIASESVVINAVTTTTHVDPATEDYHDVVTLRATVTPVGVSGTVEFFVNGSPVGFGTYVQATGVATLSHTIQLPAGSYSLRADFKSSSPLLYSDSTDTLPTGLTVTLEETTLSYTGPTVLPNGFAATMSGVLLEDGLVPITGRTVTFTLGSGTTAQSCSGLTNVSGLASCVINPVAQPLGPRVVGDTFAGDTFYQPATANASTVVFAFATGGAFVVGDLSALGSEPSTFWSSEWHRENSMSGGAAPEAFKGFANILPAGKPACGITWSSAQGGNSVDAPATVPSYMGVLVASNVTKSRATSTGNVVRIVVVQTNPGYGLGPGRRGSGLIIAELCH